MLCKLHKYKNILGTHKMLYRFNLVCIKYRLWMLYKKKKNKSKIDESDGKTKKKVNNNNNNYNNDNNLFDDDPRSIKKN